MKKILGLIGVSAVPLVASAQTPFLNILDKVRTILDTLIPLLITLALVYFIWGVGKFVTAKEETEKTNARDIMIYGAIALFVIVSIWGIVGLLQEFTGLQGGGSVDLPFVPIN